MKKYSWEERYQIPEMRLKTENYPYEPLRLDLKLSEAINVSLPRNDDPIPKTNRTKVSFPGHFRHSTDQGETFSNMLEKSYKYFEPQSLKLKHDFAHVSIDYKSQYDTSKKYYQNEPEAISPVKEVKFKSLKEITANSKDKNSAAKKNYKLWSSTKIIQIPTKIQKLKSPEKLKQPEAPESPYTFVKKNRLFYTTPQTNKNEKFDQISTKYGSPNNSVQISLKYLTLKQFKKDSVRPPQLEDFVIIKHLGEGRFGSVSMAVHKVSGFFVALKKVKKAVIKAHKLQNQFTMEVKMQLFLNHPNLLKLYGYFDDHQNVYLILEIMEEGTLFNKLKKQKEKHFDECTTSQRMDDVLHGIKYMHDLEIAHRDIKPENIVMSNGVCKVCDFGWAAVCENRRTTLCGTIDYAPPEVLEGKQYGITMDLWCLGVLCYELLVGKAPFYHVSRKQTMQKIIKADTSELKLPEQLSKDAIDFINKFLIKNPDERMFTQDALQHTFIQKYVEKDEHQLRGKYR